MAISTNCSYTTTATGFDFTFIFNVSSTSTITHVYIEYSGQNNSGQPIMEIDNFNPNTTTFSWKWNVSSGITINKPGTFKIIATNKNGETHTSNGQWGDNKVENTTGSYLTVWGAGENYSSDYVKLWGYADSNPEVTYATFKWTGKDKNGNNVSGEQTIWSIYDKTVSVSLMSNCSIKYPCNVTVTMSNGILTKSSTYTVAAQSSTPSTKPTNATLTVTSLMVDNSKTTGMKNGKYVVGTKLMLVAKVTSSAGTKKVRYRLTGAKTTDNEWEVWGATTLEAQSTATAAGIINVEVIVTDNLGNTASKTLAVTISEEDNYEYYGYYFFNKDMTNALQKNGIVSVSIKLYNVFNDNSSQIDPAGLSFTLYGHSYESYSACKNSKNPNSSLTMIKTFTALNQTNQPYIDIPLTDAEWQKLRSLKGLAFSITDKNKLTVHGVQCALDIEYI